MRLVCSCGPVQELYAAAKNYLDCFRLTTPYIKENGRHGKSPWLELIDAVEAVEKMAEESDALAEVRDWARDQYIDSACDIDIDDHNLTHHNGTDGYWVGAWLWVPDDFREEAQPPLTT